jgi:membrane fusion protein (multidrug efflux system)
LNAMCDVRHRRCCAFTVAVLLSLAVPARANEALDAIARRAACIIEPNSVVKLGSPIQGTLAKVEVLRGDQVQKGQVVARLESEVEEALVEAAELKANSSVIIQAKEAESRNADAKLQRAKELIARQIASQAQYDEALANAVVARFAIEQARFEKTTAEIEARRMRAILERRIIRSPVDGFVTKVDLHAGEYADPSVPILVIAENRPLLVQVYLPMDAYPRIAVGMRAEVRPQEPVGGTYIAELAIKDPQIDAASSLFQVTFRLPNADGSLPSGIRCSIRFLPK